MLSNDDAAPFWEAMHDKITSMPAFFKEHGYHTWTVGKVFHGPHHDGVYDESLFSGGNYGAFNCTNDDVETRHEYLCPVPDGQENNLPDAHILGQAKDFLKTIGAAI